MWISCYLFVFLLEIKEIKLFTTVDTARFALNLKKIYNKNTY